MLTYIVRRLLLMIPMLFGAAVIIFGLLQIIPGDPASVFLGPEASQEMIDDMRESLGLDRPMIVQLGLYLGRLVRGDLGDSIFQKEPVLKLVLHRLPATLELTLIGLLISVTIGVPLGIVAAVRRGSIIDAGSMIFAQLGVSMPVFWLGILLMFWFAVRLGWLPSIGRGEPLIGAIGAAFSGQPQALLGSLSHLILPAITLGLHGAAYSSRVTRSAMLDTLSQDYIRTAISKGLSHRIVTYRHALRNALLPVVSVIGLQFGMLLGGAVLTETIFAWPGMGRLAVGAIAQRDIPLIQGIVLVIALLFSLVNLGVDLLYTVIDPRVRYD